ncbi:MAG: class I SAM-dependent methyltransferase [Acidiferrobacteraceae bacterium]|nr:class I SAM-dependent methyltransferase [Acidiferrobacteraceae bacterium]
MSHYENYSRTSATYDRTRQAQGIEIICRLLSHNPLPLSEQVLVDAGCGTGQYSAALIDSVQHIQAIDLNPGMLTVAGNKLQAQIAAGNIELHQGSIDELPIDDESADAVMVNQVLHHLADDATAGWPAHQRVFAEFARVLKPGGVAVINSCSHAQLEQGFWFYHLIPEAVDRVQQRTADLDVLGSLLQHSGFGEVGHETATDIIMQGDAYFDADRVLDPQWRDGDSIWALATPAEQENALQKVRTLVDQGELHRFMRRHDETRLHSGQLSFTWAVLA